MQRIKSDELRKLASNSLPPIYPLTTFHALSASVGTLVAATLNNRGSVIELQSLEPVNGCYEVMSIGPAVDGVCELQCRKVGDNTHPVAASFRDLQLHVTKGQ